MISLFGVLCIIVVHSWMPATAHARIARALGRGSVRSLDGRVADWRDARSRRLRGQPETTRLLQMLVGELNAGITTPLAFLHVMGQERISPALLIASPPTADVHIWRDVARVWAASDRAGLSMVTALQRIHAYALVDQEVAREVQANVAAPRFAVATLVMLPMLAWLTAGATGAKPIEFLTHTPAGWICSAVGLLLFAGAAWWMQVLTRQALT